MHVRCLRGLGIVLCDFVPVAWPDRAVLDDDWKPGFDQRHMRRPKLFEEGTYIRLLGTGK